MVAEHAAKNDSSMPPALPLLSPAVPLSSQGGCAVNTEKETGSFRTRSTTVTQLWQQALAFWVLASLHRLYASCRYTPAFTRQ